MVKGQDRAPTDLIDKLVERLKARAEEVRVAQAAAVAREQKTDPLQQYVQAILDEIPRLTAVVDRIRSFEEPSDQDTSVLVDSKRK